MMQNPSTTPELKLSFMSANFVARENNYAPINGFGEGSKAISEALAPAATYAERIDAICAEIAAMGFSAVDLWTAHCSPEWATPQHFKGLIAALERHHLKVTSIAGGMGSSIEALGKNCKLARDLDCRQLGVGGKLLPDQIDEVARTLDEWEVELAFENHPGEPTPDVVLERIGHGRFHNIGCAFDSGWWGTHGYPLMDAYDKLRPHIRLVHLKNVEGPGAHISAKWDEGCLDLKPFVQALKRDGYSGIISLEYEPFSGDPKPAIAAAIPLVQQWWNA